MLWHLNYQINRAWHHENYYLQVEEHGEPYPTYNPWVRVFKNVDCEKEIKELNLEGMNVFPRYSFVPAGAALAEHIDEDEIIGINFTLHNHPVDIHLKGIPYTYEAAVVDVGHVPHSVQACDYDRLILKFAIREPLEEVLDAVSHVLSR